MERRTALSPFAAACSAPDLRARTRRALIAASLLLLLTTVLQAAPEARQPRSFLDLFGRGTPRVVSTTPHPAVVRVVANERNAQSQGSGTLVDVHNDCGLVVTNWHVIRDATGDIIVHFPDGFASQARVLKVDKDWDLAALVIWKPKVDPVMIAADAPRPGDPLTIAGYGSGNYRAAAGRCTQYVAPDPKLPYEMVEVSAEARQGDSGGPIFNQRGELAGVLFGAGGGSTSGSYSQRVRGFLASVAPNLSPAARSSIAGGETAPATMSATARPAAQPTASADTTREPDTWAGPAARHRLPPDPSSRLQAAPPLLPSYSSQSAGAGNDSSPIETAARPANQDFDSDRPATSYSPDFLANTTPRRSGSLTSPVRGPNWQALFGPTPFEQAKSIMALVGILAIVLKVVRMAK